MAAHGVIGQVWDPSTAPVIVAMGLATPLGQRAANVVAAYRCGLSRTSPSRESKVIDDGSGMESPLLVHQASGVSDGYEQFGRWFRLASIAASDLAAEHDLAPARRIGSLAVLPDSSDDRFPEFVEDDAALPDMVAAAFPPEWRVEKPRIERGELAFTRAVYAAAFGVSSVWDRAVILGADSLVDQSSLAWLQTAGRLKNDQNPVGLVPGEAGVCLVVESRAAAEQRGTRARARIRAAVSCSDTGSDRVDERASRNLAACIRTALSTLDGGSVRGAAMFTDLNGETSRALRVGFAMSSVTDCLVDPTMEHPAVCFGETGAAFGPLATCLVVGSFDRGYARSPVALITNTDESGGAGCVVLQRP